MAESHNHHCNCGDCLDRMAESVRRSAREQGSLEARTAQLEKTVDMLIRHIDTWAHAIHRSYHIGPAGYFNCAMPACSESAALVRSMEKR